MNKNQLWMVRAGSGAYLVDDFLIKNIVSIGWNEVGDLSKVSDLNKIKGLIRENFPDYTESQVIATAGQIRRFTCCWNSESYGLQNKSQFKRSRQR